MIDLQEAARFLDALGGDSAGVWSFQTLDDSAQKRRELARTIHSMRLEPVAGQLQALNDAGAGVFVTVNQTDGKGRKAANVRRVRALFLDADGVALPATWHLKPCFIVRRDGTHWHAYWVLSNELPLDKFEDAQRRLAALYGTDSIVHDLPRVMRVPGFLHRKAEPILVRMECPLIDPEAGKRWVYSSTQVLAGVPELPEPVQTVATPATPRPRRGSTLKPGETLSDYERAKLYVQALPAGQEGSRNKQLYVHALYLIEAFPLAESDHLELMLSWSNACRLPEPEARETIGSAYKHAKNAGKIGSKYTQPKPKGAPLREPGGPETVIDLPEETIAEGAAAVRDKKQSAEGATSKKPLNDNPAVETTITDFDEGGGDDESGPISDADCDETTEVGELFPTRRRLPQLPEEGSEAHKWLSEDFYVMLRAAETSDGATRDQKAEELFDRLTEYLPGVPTVTTARIREAVCKKLKMTKADFNRAYREATQKRAAAGDHDGGDEADWPGIARMYLESLKPGRAIKRWREEWYEWTAKEGCYVKQEAEWMRTEAVNFLESMGIQVSSNSVTNFIEAFRAKVYLRPDIKPPYWLNGAPEVERAEGCERGAGVWISMQNGIVRIDHPGRPMVEHTPDFWCLCALPYPFDASATCPEFRDAVATWQPDADGQALGMRLLQDWAGYCLLPGQREQKFLLNIGPGLDGKSQFAAIMKALAGERNCSFVGFEAFDPKNEHGLVPLAGKVLNITGDASEVERLSEGIIKQITGGDPVMINPKFKTPFPETLDVKFMVAANHVPFFRDRSNGIWRRFLILNWKPLPEKAVIKEFGKRLIESEISGIFNWAIEGFDRVRREGFKVTGVLEENIEKVRIEIQHELKFFDECLGIDVERQRKVFTKDLVAAYKDWCVDHNVKAALYPGNLGKALRKWARKRLQAEVVSDIAEKRLTVAQLTEIMRSTIKGWTGPELEVDSFCDLFVDEDTLVRRETKLEVGQKQRREFYQGVWIRETEEQEQARFAKLKGITQKDTSP